MAKPEALASWVSSVRVYCDPNAHSRDQFGRLVLDQIKSVHDQLFQLAIDLNLASTLVLMDAKYLPRDFKAKLSVMISRPKWWPANKAFNNRKDLLGGPIASFNNSWRLVRDAAEANRRPVDIWESDPALVFEPIPGRFLGRTASIGHEAEILYFAYGRESRWEDELKRQGMIFQGSGEARYRFSFGIPGELGGTE